MIIKYEFPLNWIAYNVNELLNELVSAKAAIASLTSIPFQRSWAEEMQVVQLKREVAGTSRIEGADFTEKELETAINETTEQLHTRSQRQAAAAVKAYRWIAVLKNDRPITSDLILHIHRLIVEDADDDHCPPGILRNENENVNFGNPRHRGANGGAECKNAFYQLCNAMQKEFRNHDHLIQALAVHYHLAAMHPFLDGNGRTARAVEALILQRTGLRDTLFIAMSNYYYEEKTEYLNVLSQVRDEHNNLTTFLKFGLKGIAVQCERLFTEIRRNISKVLFKNMMYNLFNRLQTKRKRVIAERQIEILKMLLEEENSLDELSRKTRLIYTKLQNPYKAFIRDINHLIRLGAIGYKKEREDRYIIFARLEWATEITETEFFKITEEMPKSKTSGFLS